MKVIYKILALYVCTLLMPACDDSVLDQENPAALTLETYYKTPAHLDAAVSAIYSQAKGQYLLSLGYFWLNEYQSDDAAIGGGQTEVHYVNLINGSFDATNSVIRDVWRGWYRLIHRANTVIVKAPEIKTINENLRKHRIAEAKFLRAWAYYELVINWGKVPVYTEYVTSLEGFKPRAEISEVYAQIFKDLTEAKADLSDAANVDGGRATKYAAAALLAKAYLQQGDYAKAKSELSFIVNSGKFSLSEKYMDNFIEEVRINNESVFQINFGGGDAYSFIWNGDGNETYAGYSLRHVYIAGTGWRNMIPSNSLLAEYESEVQGFAKTDPRLKYTVYFTGDEYKPGKFLTDAQQNGYASMYNGATVKTSWRKSTTTYLSDGGWFGSKINQRVIRYADVLLMLAECENELNNSAAAIAFMNQVRDRATVQMPSYPIVGKFPCSNKQEVFQAIMHERRVELGFEEVRANDLKRWKRLGKIASFPFVYTPKNPDGYLPVPLEEINSNPAIGVENQTSGF